MIRQVKLGAASIAAVLALGFTTAMSQEMPTDLTALEVPVVNVPQPDLSQIPDAATLPPGIAAVLDYIRDRLTDTDGLVQGQDGTFPTLPIAGLGPDGADIPSGFDQQRIDAIRDRIADRLAERGVDPAEFQDRVQGLRERLIDRIGGQAGDLTGQMPDNFVPPFFGGGGLGSAGGGPIPALLGGAGGLPTVLGGGNGLPTLPGGLSGLLPADALQNVTGGAAPGSSRLVDALARFRQR